ncbi:MAG: Rnase Y domain-containing protein, partial [Muribaculaceae bacterium]|nr:Rnase Y domain-containing protein [Muribaculaceae bacterium]
MIVTTIIAVVALAIGAIASYAIQHSMAGSSAKAIINEASIKAEGLKKDKIREGEKEAARLTSEAEKQANQRLQKVQQSEARAKQRELQLNQQQSENQRAKNENEATRNHLDAQLAICEEKKAELDKMHRSAIDTLEHLSCLS